MKLSILENIQEGGTRPNRLYYSNKIYSGKEKMTNAAVVISTWQSIYKLPTKWFEQFGCVIGDECH